MANTSMEAYLHTSNSPARSPLRLHRDASNEQLRSPQQSQMGGGLQRNRYASTAHLKGVSGYQQQKYDTMSGATNTTSFRNRLNQSSEQIRPHNGERSSLIQVNGSNILKNSAHQLSVTRPSRVNYDIGLGASKTVVDPYADISIGNMIQTSAKPQYQNHAPNYQVPNGMAKQYRIHGQIDLSLNKKKKSTYLSEIIDKAKNPNWKRPGPGDYSADKSLDYTKLNTNKRSEWNKEKKTSEIDVIQKREKGMKGPADYINLRKVKIPGTYNQKEKTRPSAAQNEWFAQQSPASNVYKPNEKASSLVKRVGHANMNRDRSVKEPLRVVKRNESPSPASYADADRTWNKMSIHPTKNFAYSISKEKKKSFIDIEVKKHEKIPEPGKYKDSMDQFAKLSRGTSIPHYKRGR